VSACRRICLCARVRVRARVCGSVYGHVWVSCVYLCACLCTLLCACAGMFVCASVSTCVRFYAQISVFQQLHRRASSRMCMCACVCGATVCVPRGCVGAVVARRRPAVLIARPATGERLRVRGCVRAIGRCRMRVHAGVTWTNRTPSAPWTARGGHTTVVDAAGAIYVLGGYNGTLYQDVWVSTDGGARPELEALGGTRRGTMGVLRGTNGILYGTKGY
jgi:hypothetical protein